MSDLPRLLPHFNAGDYVCPDIEAVAMTVTLVKDGTVIHVCGLECLDRVLTTWKAKDD